MSFGNGSSRSCHRHQRGPAAGPAPRRSRSTRLIMVGASQDQPEPLNSPHTQFRNVLLVWILQGNLVARIRIWALAWRFTRSLGGRRTVGRPILCGPMR
jgi:hypothetical protein